MAKLAFVYAMKDPRNGNVRYIGMTQDPGRRYEEHLKNGLVSSWVAELESEGVEPEMEILDSCSPDEARYKERERIKEYEGEHDLYNTRSLSRGTNNNGSYDFMGEDVVSYQFTMSRMEWEEWKSTLKKSETIQDRIIELIREDTYTG